MTECLLFAFNYWCYQMAALVSRLFSNIERHFWKTTSSQHSPIIFKLQPPNWLQHSSDVFDLIKIFWEFSKITEINEQRLQGANQDLNKKSELKGKTTTA